MMTIIKCVLVIHLSEVVNGLFHLHDTDVLDHRDYKDCLYSFTVNNIISEWQLVPYCIRHSVHSSDDAGDQCYGDENYTFEELKLKDVCSYHLYTWNAPIDTINSYQKYLAGNDLSLSIRHYCNCSGEIKGSLSSFTASNELFLASWFGTRCQYSFTQLNMTSTFDEIIISQFKGKQPLVDNYEVLKDTSMLTCYEGLRCHSTICLDWREICDGIFNCENGEDEPEECLLLELNECQNHEYRCRNGMCIPKTFLIDFSFDCADLSDETDTFYNWYDDSDCYSIPAPLCDSRLCSLDQFSCSDGECKRFGFPCQNGRDLFLRRSLLSTSSNIGTNADNITFECWFLMLCMSGETNTNLLGYNYSVCECSIDSSNRWQYSNYFRRICPISFVFQTGTNLLYPFVQFLYHNTSDYPVWWWPTHFCYNQRQCPAFPITGLPLIHGLSCIETKEVEDWYDISTLLIVFSSCSIRVTPLLAPDARFFHCDRSMKFISKHRVKDQYEDCYYEEDEYDNVNATVMGTLNLTDRFKCAEIDEWLPRPLALDSRCLHGFDKLGIGDCNLASDLGCQFLRGLYSPSVYYVFRENCNHIAALDFSVENETDETSCDEWHSYRCDDSWDVENGEDELNCSNTIFSYITHIVLKCGANEHYCVHRNGTMGCLSKDRAGDGIVDCLGATDERTTSCDFPDINRPFRCSNDECVSTYKLCDKNIDCPDHDDELICPWTYNSTDTVFFDFSCRNRTRIGRHKQCNDIIDCQPHGEDEWFCVFKHQRALQFSLDRIEEYPRVITDSSLPRSKVVTTFQSSAPLQDNTIIYRRANALDDWFCNRGVIVTKRSSSVECLCSPSYYGPRCEYQSERLLITLRITAPASLSGRQSGRQSGQNAIRLVACLMLDDAVSHHEEILHASLMKQMFYLNYPRPPPKQRGNWSVRLDAFSVTRFSVDFISSWLFDVQFSFLPVNRLVLDLLLKDQETCTTLTCVHGNCRKHLNSPYREYCQCEQNWSGRYCNISGLCSCAGDGKCISRYPTPICVCSLGRIGSECQALFDPCNDVRCGNGATCLPLDQRQSAKFICSCRSGYHGTHCELTDAQVDIHFSESLSHHERSLSAVVIVHFLELQADTPGILFVQNRALHKQVQLNKPLRVFNHNQLYLSSFILLEIFFEPDNFGYYIAGILKSDMTNITTRIDSSNHCSHVNELIRNDTIRGFPSIKKVKYYGHICKMSNTISCFTDETYLCFCDKYRDPDCLFFQSESTRCPTDYCKNGGRCVQLNFNGIWDFGCVCSGCTYGSLCHLTTSQYALSFDVMLGQDIIENVPLTYQPILVKLVMSVLILMIIFGFISNVLSFITFKQPKVQKFGCGIYLLCLPLVGQFGLSILAGRFFYLLGTQMYNVNHRSAALWSCIGLEYFLNVCPVLFDWLTVCVGVERSVNIIKGASFKKSDSVWWAKRVILFLIIVILASAWHEPFIRQLIDDPRAMTLHTWCVVTFPCHWLKYYRLAVNLINLIVPGSINFAAMVFLLHKSTQMKQAFVKKQSDKGYFTSLKKQLPLYGSPLVLVSLSFMRLIFSFTLVCITHQWQKYVYLTAYFISFFPLMGTFPIFVLPAKIYKTEFKNLIKWMSRIVRLT